MDVSICSNMESSDHFRTWNFYCGMQSIKRMLTPPLILTNLINFEKIDKLVINCFLKFQFCTKSNSVTIHALKGLVLDQFGTGEGPVLIIKY